MGARLAPAWDPAFAILLSVFIIYAWGRQANEHILNLVGAWPFFGLWGQARCLHRLHGMAVNGVFSDSRRPRGAPGPAAAPDVSHLLS